MRLLYGQDASVRYPDNETIYVSDSDYNQERRMVVKMDVNSGLPSATDMITEYAIDGKSVLADLDWKQYIHLMQIIESIHLIYNKIISEFIQ